ncbi:hypothetical protein MMC10_008296 [Thelotrema lepadinum]|nr:hypothetical protein [Thelotrema lepadinum]
MTEAYTTRLDAAAWREDSSWNSWLPSNKSLFWICGKAGSGKTTLMKRLCQQENTYKRLATWVARDDLIIAKLFFSDQSIDTEKSPRGLFRSLLFQILPQCPELIPEILDLNPTDTDQSNATVSRRLHVMDWPELQRLFGMLLDQAGPLRRICLFIDGIDECRMQGRVSEHNGPKHDLVLQSGDEDTTQSRSPWISGSHCETAELLTDFATRKNIKICLFSRPLGIFQDAFDSAPKLLLDEFTADRMAKYCRGKLLGSDMPFSASDRQQMLKLADEVVRKAQGVWVWVNIVVELLLRGLKNGSSPSELREYLDGIPEQLDGRTGLFMQTLRSIEPVRRIRGGRLLKLVSTASGPFDLLDLFLAEDSLFGSDTLPDEDRLTAVTSPVGELQAYYLEEKVQRMKRRLQSQCGGLVEEMPYEYDQGLKKGKYSNIIRLAHQTVKEFLSDEEIRVTLFGGEGLGTSGSHVAHLNASILRLKTTLGIALAHVQAFNSGEPPPGGLYQVRDFSEEYEYIKKAVWHARYLEEKQAYPDHVFKLLDDLDSLMSGTLKDFVCHRSSKECWRHWASKWHPEDDTPNFLAFAIKAGLPGYAEHKLRLNSSLYKKPGRPLLSYAVDDMPAPLSCMTRGSSDDSRHLNSLCVSPNPRLIQRLLVCGADPNEQYRGSSAWSTLVAWGYDLFCYPEQIGFESLPLQNKLDLWLQGAKSMLQYGADPYIQIPESGQGIPVQCTNFHGMLQNIYMRLMWNDFEGMRAQIEQLIEFVERSACKQ